MREGIALTAFTERGYALAEKLAAALGAVLRQREQPLAAWTAESFGTCAALIFIGAAGIAVRSVAPHVKSKAEDPAVLCVDETGRWVIPLLSGHLGGANALAKRVAALTGGEAVLTTATDLNGLFAVDLWAKRQNLAVVQPERIKNVSAKLLRGEEITVDCPWPVDGPLPPLVKRGAEADVVVSFRAEETADLQLAPRALCLGIGCKRGTEEETLEAVLHDFCRTRGVLPEGIVSAASIDLKREEPGLLRFCAAHGWPLDFYSAEELCRAPGAFTASAFVESTVGVDNVCERAAVLSADGALMETKFARDGVTFALAARALRLDWRWQDG